MRTHGAPVVAALVLPSHLVCSHFQSTVLEMTALSGLPLYNAERTRMEVSSLLLVPESSRLRGLPADVLRSHRRGSVLALGEVGVLIN